MTSVNRSESPITKTMQKKRLQGLVLENDKIHRIRINSEAVVQLANVASANCIWFKPKEDITDQLQFIKPTSLNKLLEDDGTPLKLKCFDYVMAPLNENTYARGRIVSLEKKKRGPKRIVAELAYVHFIDEGFGEWMDVECLAKMETSFYNYPWQAIPVSLFKLLAGQSMEDLEFADQWPDYVTSSLTNILGEYEFFRIVPVQPRMKINTYHEHTRAEIFGLVSSDDQQGESIGHRLNLELNTFPGRDGQFVCDNFDRSLFDARLQGLIEINVQGLTDTVLSRIPRWRIEFPISFDEDLKKLPTKPTPKKTMDITTDEGDKVILRDPLLHFDNNWDLDTKKGRYPIIPSFTDSLLESGGYYEPGTKNCLICVEWESVKSPYEFYAFPLMQDESLEELYARQQRLAVVLDSFYSQPDNRKTINGAIVKKAFRKNRRVFAIYECNDEVTTGSYRRVQVMAVRNPDEQEYSKEFCRIRFTDIGGNDIVPLAGLLVIHSAHCLALPMCLQLCAFRISPPNNESIWSEVASRNFRRFTRSDVPIQCMISGQISDLVVARYEDPPQKWSSVILLEKIRVFSEESTVEEKMQSAALAVVNNTV